MPVHKCTGGGGGGGEEGSKLQLTVKHLALLNHQRVQVL